MPANTPPTRDLLHAALADMGPSMTIIRNLLTRGCEQLRMEADASHFWLGIENLQLFLRLLQQITSNLGAPLNSVRTFDCSLQSCLQTLESALINGEPSAVVEALDNHLLPALRGWDSCETELFNTLDRMEV